jgi:hypothetical protein
MQCRTLAPLRDRWPAGNVVHCRGIYHLLLFIIAAQELTKFVLVFGQLRIQLMLLNFQHAYLVLAARPCLQNAILSGGWCR